jgi:hypothetical protein
VKARPNNNPVKVAWDPKCLGNIIINNILDGEPRKQTFLRLKVWGKKGSLPEVQGLFRTSRNWGGWWEDNRFLESRKAEPDDHDSLGDRGISSKLGKSCKEIFENLPKNFSHFFCAL